MRQTQMTRRKRTSARPAAAPEQAFPVPAAERGSDPSDIAEVLARIDATLAED